VARDGRHLEELTYEDCLDHLARKRLGRLAVVVGHYPQVFPVNYRLDDNVVVFRTHLGTKLLAADHANVGFQVDHVDEVTRSGWSVLIQGMAEDVTDRRNDPITERGRALDVDSWAPGDQSRIVRIIPAHMSGRQITPGELSDWSDEPAPLL
jgi:nitroimidazol reductase NimA-like FMN-containing flavoprotein (pyridoxamine 5'-phosphate oxidase superfamily)